MNKMDASLNAWLDQNLFQLCAIDEAELPYLTLEGKIMEIGSTILSLPSQSPLKVIYNEVSTELGLNLNHLYDSNSLMVLVEGLLIIAVSERNVDSKEDVVKVIMQMDTSIQSDLMQAIKDRLSRHNLDTLQTQVDDEDEEDKTMDINEQQQQQVTTTAPSSSSSSTACTTCSQTSKLLDQYRTDLESTLIQMNELESRLKNEIAVQANRLVESELLVCEKDNLISNRDSEINELKSSIDSYKKKKSNDDTNTMELQELRDEVDVLRPLAKKAEGAQEKVERLKQKVNDLLPLKDQLKLESESHKDTHSKLLDLETEVESLKKCRTRIEEYRVQYTEASIKIDELTSKLQKQDLELQQLLQSHSSAEGGMKGHVEHASLLNNELEITKEKLREMSRTTNVGGGLSEINPNLMKELDRQRKTIIELQSKLDSTSVTHMEQIEKEKSDLDAKVKSLNAKWNETKNDLEIAQLTVINLNAQVYELSNSLLESRSQYEELSEMTFEDIITIKIKHSNEILHLKKLNSTCNELSSIGNKAVIDEYNKFINMGKTQLGKLNEKIKLSVASHDESKSEIVILKSEIDSFKKRNMELEADLDQERIKRRRIEREKKFHESESHRHKIQSNSNENIDPNTDVDLKQALNELKTMQQQLDNAHKEIKILRNSCSTGSDVNNNDDDDDDDNHASIKTRRALRVRSNGQDNDIGNTSSSSTTLVDRKVEQLMRERREMIARKLEDSKEKQQISQKLIAKEKEVTTLKSSVTKLSLEKERLERRLNSME